MTIYVCPMHPEIRSNNQATCSLCGMKLEPREEERASGIRKDKARRIRARR